MTADPNRAFGHAGVGTAADIRSLAHGLARAPQRGGSLGGVGHEDYDDADASVPEDYDVAHLDFAWVAKASDLEELRSLLRVL
ncbi:hypothetical protein HK405_003863, partial [Cladochytrium tenue]